MMFMKDITREEFDRKYGVSILDKLIKTAEETNSEHSHQVVVFAWFAEHRKEYPETEWLFAIPNANSHHMVSEGVKGGVPDMMMPWAKFNYLGLVIELKIPAKGKKKAGVASDNQLKWLWHFQGQGWQTAICYGWQEARNAIISYLRKGATNAIGNTNSFG